MDVVLLLVPHRFALKESILFSFSSILTDTRNFISNNFVMISVVVLILSIINLVVSLSLSPNLSAIIQIQNLLDQAVTQHGQLTADTLSKTLLSLSEIEQQQLVSAAMSYLIKTGWVFFINNIILMSGILATVYTIAHQPISFNNLLSSVLKLAPQIALFLLLIIPAFMLLSIIGSVLMALVPPLALLAFIFYFCVYIIFSAVVIEPTLSTNFITKLRITLRFLKREIGLIVPIILICFFSTFFLKNLMSGLLGDNIVISIVINIIKSAITFTTICYLYRLFSLSNKMLPYDSRS